MEDLSEPSFSLGFDFDLPATQPAVQKQPPSSTCKEKEKLKLPPVQQEFESPSFTLLPDELKLDLEREEEAPVLKRLRKGSAPVSVPSEDRFETPHGASVGKNQSVNGGFSGSDVFSSLEDEIEDFSSQEDPFFQDGCIKHMNRSFDASSSSKISLRNQGVLTSQSTNKPKSQKLLPNNFSSSSSNLEKSDKTKLLPKLKLSPLRKIHLLDSDSDSDSDFNHNKNTQKTLKKSKPSVEIKPKKDPKSATPALDQYCEEYFKTEKDRNAPQKREEGSTSKCSSRVFDPVEFTKAFEDILPKEELSSGISNNNPPCFKYFYHSDARIRNLVRERLSHFTPIGGRSLNDRTNGESRNDNIDYMGQFGKKETVKGKRVRNGGKNDSTPQDVGKRRVQANSGSGHWFTNENGKKVYVSKNGQELTGQFAYRQYKKDKGGFRKSKKQAAGRKKGKK
ncbi:hypothetical protein LUZ60_009066 [Juncus effusus]|nr:hypothetical protein LUZ60_009066 [Juncus effusus]